MNYQPVGSVDATADVGVPEATVGAASPPVIAPVLTDIHEPDGTEPRYMIYTSGTTGAPKGTLVEHRGMVNHLIAKVVDLDLGPEDVVGFSAPLVFDISIWQMLAPLLVGGTVAVLDDSAMSFPRRLCDATQRTGCTVVELVPATVGWLLDGLRRVPTAERLPRLRWLISTGEELRPALADRVLALLPKVRLLNAYGPTECSDDVTHHVVRPADVSGTRVPVGTAVLNATLHVLVRVGSSWRPARPRESGELFVGGLPVGPGYPDDPAATVGAFFGDVIDPASPTGRLYRTGDAALVENGLVYCLGRLDRQVKISGVRIELDEVEAVLGRHPAIQRCAVVVQRDGDQADLAAYYVAGPEPVSERALCDFLAGTLPAAMVPRRWYPVDALPLTDNGKTDYRALAGTSPAGLSPGWDSRTAGMPARGAASSDVEDLARSVLPVLTEHAARVDEEACFPTAAVAELRRSGLFGLMVPRQYGGLDGDVADLVAGAKVLASGCLSTALIWAMHCQQVDSVVRYASSRLREELLPRIARGDEYLASVTTEPATGSNLLAAEESLRAGDGSILVERVAPVVTGGQYADGFLVTMRDSPEATSNRVTLVYASRAQLQLDRSGEWNPLGMRGTHSIGLRMRGEIPAYQIVGDRGGYREIAIDSMIPLAHLGWSACWLGTARAALADVIALIRSPRRPRSIDPDSPLVAERLARIRMDLELVSGYLNCVLAEVVDHRANGRQLDAPPVQIHLNTLKVAAAERTFEAVHRLIQLTGLASGYLRGSAIPLERHFRDLRSASLNYADDRLLTANGALALLDRRVRLV